MRPLIASLLVLTNCATAAAPESRPAAYSPLPCLDDTGQRELLAGFELELGDERAKTAVCSSKLADALEREAFERQQTVIVGIAAGVAGVAVGAAAAVLLTTAATRAP